VRERRRKRISENLIQKEIMNICEKEGMSAFF
jgi:hypothetical protein